MSYTINNVLQISQKGMFYHFKGNSVEFTQKVFFGVPKTNI